MGIFSRSLPAARSFIYHERCVIIISCYKSNSEEDAREKGHKLRSYV